MAPSESVQSPEATLGRARPSRFWALREACEAKILISGLVMFFLVVFLSPRIFIFNPAGHVGVLYELFGNGTQTDRVYGEGLHIIAPWDSMTTYNERYQQLEQAFSVISSNGLNVGVTVSIRYRPKLEYVGVLQKEVGPDYVNKIVIPEVQALIRQVVGQYSPEEIYTTKKSLIQDILEGALGNIAKRYLVLDNLLIKTITLPPAIDTAIQQKLVEEQRSLEMKFRIAREKKEAQRIGIEAEGIRDYQNIVAASLSEKILKFHGIRATLELAESTNARVVILSGKNGLPTILNPSLSSPALGNAEGLSAGPPTLSVPAFSSEPLHKSAGNNAEAEPALQNR